MPTSPRVDIPEFGAFAPTRGLRTALAMTRHVPTFWPGRSLASLVRNIAVREVPEVVDVGVFGSRMRLHPRDNICEKRVLFTPQFFDAFEREYLTRRVGDGFTFVDIGANVGAYSLFVASLAAGARVVAVEPDPTMFARLEFNVTASGVRQVQLIQAAVSSDSGTVDLYLNDRNRGQNSLIGDGATGRQIRVRCLTLRELLDEHEIARPDCLKIDIEGAEHLVLGPFLDAESPDRFPTAVIIEQIRRQPRSRAVQMLLDHGYQVRLQTRMNLVLEHCG